jgi:hypothetical protein
MMKAIRTMSIMAMSNVLAFTASTATTTATAMTISKTSSSSGSSRAAAVTAPSITTTTLSASASASASALSMSTSTSTSTTTKSTNNINDNDNDTANRILLQDLHQLSNYHPIFIEGMGYYDPRDPTIVANNVYQSLQSHFNNTSTTKNVNQKPYLVILQGDPLHTNGISAITRRVAKLFNCSRGLICLDSTIDPTHSKNADRENVILEFNYSQLVANLNLLSSSPDDDNVDNKNNNNSKKNIMTQLEYSIDELIIEKNEERSKFHKPPMKDYFKQYALLQEVTKASIRKVICDTNNNADSGADSDADSDTADASNSNSETTTNENQNNPITIIHTSTDINPYSVTSFYTIGIQLGLINSTTDMVSYKNYSNEDDGELLLDFDVIDTR